MGLVHFNGANAYSYKNKSPLEEGLLF